MPGNKCPPFWILKIKEPFETLVVTCVSVSCKQCSFESDKFLFIIHKIINKTIIFNITN